MTAQKSHTHSHTHTHTHTHTQIINFANSVHNNLIFSLMQKVDSNISFLDLLVQRTTQGFEISIYRKSTSTDMVIHFTSSHPIEHKRAALRFLLSRIHQLLKKSKNGT